MLSSTVDSVVELILLQYVYNQRVAHICYSNMTARRVRTYQIRHSAYKKTAPEDELIQAETCTAYIENKV